MHTNKHLQKTIKIRVITRGPLCNHSAGFYNYVILTQFSVNKLSPYFTGCDRHLPSYYKTLYHSNCFQALTIIQKNVHNVL